MQIPDHLQKSRHGIWYYRWVVPFAVRSRHPGLQGQLERSTNTADMRAARVAVRRLHQAFLTKLVDGTVKFDPQAGIVT